VPSGRSTQSGPGAAVFNGELWVFVRGLDNQVYQNRLAACGWTGWSRVPGSTFSGPGTAAAASSLYLVVRGTDNKIYLNQR
jgi:hypothetical protein